MDMFAILWPLSAGKHAPRPLSLSAVLGGGGRRGSEAVTLIVTVQRTVYAQILI